MDLDTSQVLDALVASYESAGNNARLVCRYRISIGAANLKWAIGKVDLGVSSQVLLEIKLLLSGLEPIIKASQAVGRKQLCFSQVEVWLDNDVVLY